ncbi:hypothetical protein DFS34DRAFT_212182 [Phlyctochytrium arcticum]|nr:hypothetical protein DFS34DRAFT_212182 [Phlyctochytrium arcticum]
MYSLKLYRGYIGLFGPGVDDIASHAKDDIPVPRQTSPFHITLYTKEESHSANPDSVLMENMDIRPPIDLGLGKRGEVYFSVLWWPQGHQIRAAARLPAKDFHITLSASDRHDVDKSIASLVKSRKLTRDEAGQIVKDLQATTSPEEHSVKMAEHLVGQLLSQEHDLALSDQQFNFLWNILERAGKRDTSKTLIEHQLGNDSVAALVRLADTYYKEARWKTAMLVYAKAALKVGCGAKKNDDVQELELRQEKERRVYSYCVDGIRKCASKTEFGLVFTPAELQENTSLARNVRDSFTAAVAAHPDLTKFDFLCREKREQLVVPRSPNSEYYRLPRFFRWVVPFFFAVMSTPRHREDIDALRSSLGINLVVTLTRETPLPAEWFKGTPSRNVFLPVDNYRVPTIEQVGLFMDLVTGLPDGESALVHCGGGVGRAGIFVACYLCACGFTRQRQETPVLSAADAIRILRSMRPTSIENKEQEDFVGRYVQHLYKTVSQPPKTLIPEPTGELAITGQWIRKPSLIVCCGLPGSGKSTFAATLGDHFGFDVVCQDELGSRDACEAAISTAAKSGKSVIVDRCNPTPEQRHLWVSLSFAPTDALCVWFDYPVDLCMQRANSRTAHPTITQGRAGPAITSFEKQFVPPTLKEGFSCIARVPSLSAADALQKRFGIILQNSPTNLAAVTKTPRNVTAPISKIGLYKFPRTRHLIPSLGASRDDLILSPDDAASFLDTSDGSTLILEEKVDGSNMGISIDDETLQFRVQNRSHYVNVKSHQQFRLLDNWLSDHSSELFELLRPPDLESTTSNPHTAKKCKYILYGEWLYARHSIRYESLPDLFLVFDLFEAHSGVFLSRAEIAQRLATAAPSLHQVPQLNPPPSVGRLNATHIQDMVLTTRSTFYDGIVEGISAQRKEWACAGQGKSGSARLYLW